MFRQINMPSARTGSTRLDLTLTFGKRQPVPYTSTPYPPPQMRRDTLEPQLPHLSIRPDEPLPFSRTTGREDDPFPDGNTFGLVFGLFRGAAGSVGEAFLFCAGGEFQGQ
jgi:hypothetical protein